MTIDRRDLNITSDRDARLAAPSPNPQAEIADALREAGEWRQSVLLYRGSDNGAGAKRLARSRIAEARLIRLGLD